MPAATHPPARWALPAAVAAWTASALFCAGLWLMAPGWAKPLEQSALVLVIALVPLSLGVVVARAAPGNAAGPLLALAGFFAVATNFVAEEAIGPFVGTWMLLYLSFAILLLVVPGGHAASRRWRTVGWVIVAVVLAFNALCAVQWAVPSLADATTIPSFVLLFGFFALLIVCAAAPVVRFRHATESDRTRLRWIFLAGTSLPLTLLLCWTSYLLVGNADLVGFGLVLMYLAIPAGATIAIVRPGLLDIDRATVATATATVLAVGILGVLSVAAAAVGVSLVQWSPPISITVLAILTGAAAILFPLLQRALDRLLYPERGRAVAALRQLSARVEAGAESPRAVEDVLRRALRDPGLTVASRDIGGGQLHLLDGQPATKTGASAHITARGEEIGAIIPSPNRLKRPAAAVVRAAAPLIEAIRTDAVVAEARSEVEASRERLLRAGYEERRRLERDLHDGAQQRLIALGMNLRVLQRTSPAAPKLDAALDAAVAELGTVVAELRRIAHGVRPSALDDGLGAALADLTQLAPEMVELDVQIPQLPDAVATTAYYVASEALTNALRHAAPSRIRITASAHEGTLRMRIDDDGSGGASLTPTGGLTGLADRVAALGGELAVDSRRGTGTTVEARLPCAS
jgi:signal transduction histidine kinase